MSVKRKRKLKSKLRLFMFSLILVGLFAGGFAAANNFLWPLIAGEPLVDLDPTDDEADKFAKMPGINVLMMGVDERSDETSLRTDTMILANINNKDNRVALLSIPRDTKVNLPGHGVNKINAANVYGGPELAMEKVSELTGVAVDYYVLTNFGGFKDIVDALGGVTVDVEDDLNYDEKAYGGAYSIHLKEGVQELDGDKALQYVRFRHDGLGDITRTQRQLKLLTAIGNETMQIGTITKLHKLVPQIYKNVKTNLKPAEMAALAKAARNLDNVQIVTQTMPGWFLDDGASYWYVDPEKAREVATALFEEGKVVEVVQGAISNDTPKQVAMESNRSTGQEQRKASDADADANDADDAAKSTDPADNTGTAETDVDESIAGGEDNAGGDSGNISGEQQQPGNTSPHTSTSTAPDEGKQGEPVESGHVDIIINP
ncbi:LCP family protein [Desulfoscipio sp. XC116]|uniref:LCP family protein n=1 Tax=Desulfoscipio sp. XC116 TaxID=3144975 RepID=UPI00325BB322